MRNIRNDNPNFSDEVDITIVYNDFKEEDRETIISGIYVFIDNYLGELYSATTIDNLNIIGIKEVTKELIPIEKLKSYLIWREKEFVEKYEGERDHTENDSYSTLEAKTKDGNPIIAVANSTVLEWDRKASHPYILKISIPYDGENNNGLPDKETFNRLNKIEDELMLKLEDSAGFLNVCHTTGDNEREIYFACKDFRKPSKVLCQIIKNYQDKLDVSYDIYKDKYWQSLEWFRIKQ
ncbi:hypothetical protein FACS189437_06620 [Bacteroidia bacterium]|nr:hypothetical protein FACS189437_06620 [Bacteroidia bacterium]